MYTEEYERRGFPFRDFILKLILVIIFVLLLVWLLPKFIKPTVNYTTKDGKACPTSTCDTTGISALTSQIFADNLERMKDAAISYYTDERLPKEVGESDTMTLSDMIGKKIIIALIDKNNKACDLEKSYVKITKLDEEYILKVNLKDSEKEDYILVHLGCYTYCEGTLCQKQGAETPVKGSKYDQYVPIKGSVDRGVYYPPKNVTPVVPTNPKCAYKNGKYYDKNGKVVSKTEYENQCFKPTTKYYCVKKDGKYYDDKGNVVSESAYKKACNKEEKHYCVKYDGKYYDDKGNVVSESAYKKACNKPENKHYCVKYDGKYYDDKGNVVSESAYKKACNKEEKHYCVYYNGKYYDSDGNVTTEQNYKKECTIPEEKHYCVKYDGKYYDDKGNVVSESTYKKACNKEEKHYCGYYDGKYYGKNGDVVSKETYKKQCETTVEYIYEYKKTTPARFSDWTSWSSWSKTNCSTQEINCSDSSTSCLKKLQIYKRKEQIGTYEKTYARTRSVMKQTGSYTQKSCSKYNYVEINKTIYATTTTTTYTQTNTITSSTKHTTGAWVYNGRASYSNPPRDTEAKHYKFVGADYSYCSETCTTLPNYYYDSYTYTGGLTSVSSTTTPGSTTSSSSSSTSSSTSTTTQASCGEYVTKTIPIYGSITVTEKATRTEPLYGTTCYQSTKTRSLLSNAVTTYKWSTNNDTTLLNNGWTLTGNKKQK